MRIVNRSAVATDVLRPYLEHGAAGIRDAGVLVVLADKADWSGRYSGYACWGVESRIRCAKLGVAQAEYTVILKLRNAENCPARWHGQGLKWFDRRFPSGVPIESPVDYLVTLTAHEFRHVWQFRRAKAAMDGKARPRRLGELDAEFWAVDRLSRFRVLTGRSPIEPAKQPVPAGLAKSRAACAALSPSRKDRHV